MLVLLLLAYHSRRPLLCPRNFNENMDWEVKGEGPDFARGGRRSLRFILQGFVGCLGFRVSYILNRFMGSRAGLQSAFGEKTRGVQVVMT